MIITRHALEKAKSLGMPKTYIEELVLNAYNYGIGYSLIHTDFMRRKMRGYGFKRTNPKFYLNHMFIFSDKTLVTFYRLSNKSRKRLIKNT